MTLFVAEVGPCNGDLDYALRMVDAMADAGADVIKGQLYTADGLVTDDAPRYDRTGGHEGTQHDAFQTQLSLYEWEEVAGRCHDVGVGFTITPFFLDALDWLVDLHRLIDVPFIKIASADITHRTLIQAAAATGIPLVISTGAADGAEIARAGRWARHTNPDVDLTLLACTLSYPCDDEDAHVNRLVTLRDTFAVASGYSDHTVGWSAAQTARQLGATIIEKHVTLTPGEGGDHDFAATPAGVRTFQKGRTMWTGRTVEGSGRLVVHDCELEARKLARRSVCAARDLQAGHVLSEQDVTWLRPGGGIDPWVDVTGGTLTRDVKARTTLSPDDIE